MAKSGDFREIVDRAVELTTRPNRALAARN
jgi:hypothetical protein